MIEIKCDTVLYSPELLTKVYAMMFNDGCDVEAISAATNVATGMLDYFNAFIRAQVDEPGMTQEKLLEKAGKAMTAVEIQSMIFKTLAQL